MDITKKDSSREEFLKPGTPVPSLSDADLERHLLLLVTRESGATADIVEHVAEFENRRLFAPKRFPSMFEYCTKTLGYSEGAAYLRIYAGRLSREYPEILDLLRTRRLHLTAVRTVGPYLNTDNHLALLTRSLSKSERELKFLVAEVAPKPEQREVVRHIPPAKIASAKSEQPPEDKVLRATAPEAPSSIPEIPPPPRIRIERDVIEPISLKRVRFGFTGSESFLEDFDRMRELLRRKHPSGALENIFAEAVDFYLNARDPARKAKAAPMRDSDPRRRVIPQWVKDSVFHRDGGRCAFVSAEGARCEEKGALEYDHIVPWAKGGPSNDPSNVRLLCRTHNALEARRIFGPGLKRRS